MIPSEEYMKKILKECFEMCGSCQSELGRMAGVSRSTVQSWISRETMSFASFVKLSELHKQLKKQSWRKSKND